MSIRIRCLVFGKYAEVLGIESTEIELSDGANVDAAIERLRETIPGGGAIPRKTMVAINQEHVLGTRELCDGDELALLPPLAGG